MPEEIILPKSFYKVSIFLSPKADSLVQLSHVQLFMTIWTAGQQTSLSITNCPSLLKLMSIKSVMPSNHLSLCCPLLLPPSIFPRIRVFSNESVPHIRWPKYWSFSFTISPSSEYHSWNKIAFLSELLLYAEYALETFKSNNFISIL